MAEYRKHTIVEALLFASVEPVPLARLAETAGIGQEEAEKLIEVLNGQYEEQGRAFRIRKISGGYQFRTLGDLGEYIQSLGRQVAAHRLSPAALEALAIVAYRQPIGRAEVEKIRGVNSSGVLRTLIEKKLITVCGRAQELGRPLLYGTTPQFLRYFGLSELGDLPRESELEVMLSQAEQSRREQEEDREEPDSGPEDTGDDDSGQQVLM